MRSIEVLVAFPPATPTKVVELLQEKFPNDEVVASDYGVYVRRIIPADTMRTITAVMQITDELSWLLDPLDMPEIGQVTIYSKAKET